MQTLVFIVLTFFSTKIDKRTTTNPCLPIGIEDIHVELDGIQKRETVLLKLKG